MKLFGIVVTLIILIIGIAQQNKYPAPQKTSESVLFADTEISPTPQPKADQSLAGTPTAAAFNPQPADLQVFRYPAVSVVSSDANSMHLTSTDSADAITNWYKEKIQSAGMSTKSFVTTKTNGNVKNVLVGTNGHTEIRVEITKNAGDVSTQITVTVRTY